MHGDLATALKMQRIPGQSVQKELNSTKLVSFYNAVCYT